MRTRSKLAVAGLGATLLLALGVSTASARSFEISSQTFRTTFNSLRFTAGGGLTDTCNVTFEGSLHSRTLDKMFEALIGYITRGEIANCRIETTLLTERIPWHIKYVSFSGRLPNISQLILLIKADFRIVTCLADVEIVWLIPRNPSTTEIAGAEIPQNMNLPLDGILCPTPRLGTLVSDNRGTFTVLNSGGRVSVRLI